MSRRTVITVTLEELEQLCSHCGHQNAVHTGGADRGIYDWAIYNRVWSDASGTCRHPRIDPDSGLPAGECGCDVRTRLRRAS